MSNQGTPGSNWMRGHAATAVVAMIGAGQLARMTQQAAIALDVELRVLAASLTDPAVLAGAAHQLGRGDDLGTMLDFAEGADAVTFDHELIHPDLLAALESRGVNLQPSAGAKLLAQDKLHARRELARLGFPVPPFAHVRTLQEVERFAGEHAWPLIAKTPRGGYDGRGVFELPDPATAERELASHPDGLLLEPLLPIERELAVLVARRPAGEVVAYPVVESVQRGAMCTEVLAPAPVAAHLVQQATELAVRMAQDLGVTGIMALELFDVGGDTLYVNELALRPHNSGHYTIEGCETSQFEQHLRAILDWPLGSTALTAPAVAMANVIGSEDDRDPRRSLAQGLAVSGAHVHLYGKGPRAGRKLGHVTVRADDLETAREAALRAAGLLGSEVQR